MPDHALHELYVRWRPWWQGRSRRRRQRFAWFTRRTRLHHHGLRGVSLLCACSRGEDNGGNVRGKQCPNYNSSHRARLVLAAKIILPPVGCEGEGLHWTRTEFFHETGNFHRAAKSRARLVQLGRRATQMVTATRLDSRSFSAAESIAPKEVRQAFTATRRLAIPVPALFRN